MIALLHPIALLRAIYRTFILESISVHAAGLAFKTLLSLIPLGVVVAAIYTVVEFKESGPEPIQEAAAVETPPPGEPGKGTKPSPAGTETQDSLGHLRQAIEKLFVPDQAQKAIQWIENQVRTLRGSSTPLTVLGLILLCTTAFFLFQTVETVMNRIFHVRTPRSTGAQLLAFWAFLTLGPLLIGASLYATHLFSRITPEDGAGLRFLAEVITTRGLLVKAFPYCITLMGFFFLTWLAPNTQVRVVPALLGALFSAAVWETAKHGFNTFLAEFSNYDVLYGSLATGIILLLWLYLSWYLALLGATTAYHLQYPPGRSPWPGTEARSRLALGLVVEITSAYESGAPPPSLRKLAGIFNCPEGVLKELTSSLEDAGILARVENHSRPGYLPARAPETVLLKEVYQALGTPVGGSPAGPTGSIVAAFFQDIETGAESVLGSRTVADMLKIQPGGHRPEAKSLEKSSIQE